MGRIEIKKISIENFKGIKQLTIDFANLTKISARNAVGKTTLLDAFLWVLFDCDSQYRSKFAIRPINKDGNMIRQIDINVAVDLVIDDVEYTLSKVQKEIWTKHRGNEKAEFEGNKNSFEINGYPKSDKEYKKFIAETIGELDIIKMLTDPRYFPNLKWQEQRKIIMSLYKDTTDVELASKNDMYAVLIPELKIASTDDIKNKYSKALKEFKASIVEIPIRIDEIEKSRVDYDASALELDKNRINEEINQLTAEMKAVDNDTKSRELQYKKETIEYQIDNRKRELEGQLIDKKFAIKQKIREQKNVLSEKDIILGKLENRIVEIHNELENSSLERDKYGKRYHELNDTTFNSSEWVFDDSSEYCKSCGQKLPKDKIAELRKAFDEKVELAKKNFEISKSAEMKKCIDDANVLKANENSLEEELKKVNSEIEIIRLFMKDTRKEINLLELEEKQENSINLYEDDTWNALSRELDNLNKQIEEVEKDTVIVDVSAQNTRLVALTNELDEVNKKLLLVANNVAIDEREAELREELKSISQKCADQEKMLYILDEFIKFKLNFISEEINKHFSVVNFKLFETQINGGIKETCECTYDGIGYGNLNTGHKLLAGLDIINALADIYELSIPIWLDNAECLSSNNIPKSNNQLIMLSVSDDTELKVESEE